MSSGPMPRGLTRAEVAERRVPAAASEGTRTIGAIVRGNLLSVFNLTVFSVALALVVVWAWKGDPRTLTDGLAISTVAALNTLVSIVQEIRAKRALDRVAALARPTCTVIREGESEEIPVAEIVPGDVVRLRRGDQIPADGAVIVSQHCEVDESLLTGESEYLAKDEGAAVRSGSFCVAGGALVRADVVGAEAYAHRLTREARSYKRSATPLQKGIDRLVSLLMVVAAVLATLTVGSAVGREAHGDRLIIETTRSVAAVVTSMIPVGLVLLSTVAFALGVARISRRGALVQKLNAVESFAHVDVLCMDKTGTLTQGRMRVAEILAVGETSAEEAQRLLGALAAACTEQNATVAAIQAYAPGAKGEASDEIPFNSRDKLSAVSITVEGRARHLFLGALTALGGQLPPEDRAVAAARIEARPGMRHVILAECVEAPPSLREHREARGRLTLRALVSVADEVRPDVHQVLAGFASQAIELKVVSGDAPETVRAVALSAGLPGADGPVVTGADLDALGPEELAERAAGASLFARVSPQNKRDLVKALQGRGRYVAMVGDGVNDVLALKQADLGVAMGAGDRMAKDVSDLVLVGNDFAVLPAVLEEGRTIIGNVQSAARLFVTKNVYAAALIVAALLLGAAFPFVPRHVTVIGVFAISLPALMITFTRRVHDVPRDFLGALLRFAGVSGGVIAASALSVYLGALFALGATVGVARTLLLSTLVPLGLWNFLLIVGGRHFRENLRRNWEMSLFAFAAAALYAGTAAASLGVAWLAPLRRFLELSPPSAAGLVLVAAATVIGGATLAALQLGQRG